MPYIPESLTDTTDNNDELKLSFLPEEDLHSPTKSFNTETFVHFCHLSQLINEKYQVIYNDSATSHSLRDRIFQLEGKIRAFYRDLPELLKIENASFLEFCPPPHIFSLNVLYHVTLILLYRPSYMWSTRTKYNIPGLASRARKICVDEACKVNEFVQAHGRTFKFRVQTYLVSYCIYTAATVDVFEVKSNDGEAASAASERLYFTLQMLESEARQTPGMKRSIDIIQTRLRTLANPPISVPPSALPKVGVASFRSWQERTIPSPNQPTLYSHQMNIPREFPADHDSSAVLSQDPTFMPYQHFEQRPTNFSSNDHSLGEMPNLDIISNSQFPSSSFDSPEGQSPWLEFGAWNASAGFIQIAVDWNAQDANGDFRLIDNDFWSLK